jgi:class 3 adenylate cyclase
MLCGPTKAPGKLCFGLAVRLLVPVTGIAGFTSLVEVTAPAVLDELLNEYMRGMTEFVFSHEGTITKIRGDAVEVLLDAPGDQRDYASRAVACAMELDPWAEAFRRRWYGKGVTNDRRTTYPSIFHE